MNNKTEELVSGRELIDEIESLCKGLIYISETDARVVAFTAGIASEVTSLMLVKIADINSGSQCEEADFETFFDRLTAVHEWYTSEQKKNTKKFARLRDLLNANLSDLNVFRFGKIQIEIFAVGLDAEGNLVGIRTRSVET